MGASVCKQKVDDRKVQLHCYFPISDHPIKKNPDHLIKKLVSGE